ncbi:MAG TPA: organic hydroperoxide resistance protein [Herpetosiphonaceae bacterium]
MSEKVLFTASATAHGGRAGKITSDDGQLALQLTPPKELGGQGGEGTNPEQLFAAGYAACFQSALGLIARRARVDTSASTIRGEVSLSPNGQGGYQLGVTLRIALPGVDEQTAHQLIESAHQVCPYSNAVRGNIDVALVLEPGQEA